MRPLTGKTTGRPGLLGSQILSPPLDAAFPCSNPNPCPCPCPPAAALRQVNARHLLPRASIRLTSPCSTNIPIVSCPSLCSSTVAVARSLVADIERLALAASTPSPERPSHQRKNSDITFCSSPLSPYHRNMSCPEDLSKTARGAHTHR